jgi:UDP-sulfoquinovose synthase
MDLAERVQRVARKRNLKAEIEHLPNPRVEAEEHYFNAKHSALPALGLKPNLLTDPVIEHMIAMVQGAHGRIDPAIVAPTVAWRQK